MTNNNLTKKLQVADRLGAICIYSFKRVAIYKEVLAETKDNNELTTQQINKVVKHNLGYYYNHGYGCKKDLIKSALYYIDAAANLENPSDSFNALNRVCYHLMKEDRIQNLITVIEKCKRGVGLFLLQAYFNNQNNPNLLKDINDINSDCLKPHEYDILHVHDFFKEQCIWNGFIMFLIYDYNEIFK